MKIYYDSKLAKSLLFGSFKTCMFFGVVLTEYTALSEKVRGFMSGNIGNVSPPASYCGFSSM